MKKLSLIALAIVLVVALAVPTMAAYPSKETYDSPWGTPTIDAEKDACYALIDTVDATAPNIWSSDDYDGDISGTFYMCNDDTYLYIYVEVTDSTVTEVTEASWAQDSAEIFLCNDYTQCKIPFDAFCGDRGGIRGQGEGAEYWGSLDLETDVLCACKHTDTGYIVEGAIPFEVDVCFDTDENDVPVSVTIGLQVNDFKDADVNGSNAADHWRGIYGVQAHTNTINEKGNLLNLATEAPETEAPVETEAPAEETEAPAEETEAPSDDPSPVTADIAVIAAGIALAAAAVVVFKKH